MTSGTYSLSSETNGGASLSSPSRTAGGGGLEGSGVSAVGLFGGMIDDAIGSGATAHYCTLNLVHLFDDGTGSPDTETS